MKPRSSLFPSQSQLIFPLIEAVNDFGGRASARDVADAVADRLNIAAHARTATTTTADGQVVGLWRRHVRYAREKAKAMGYLSSERRGGTWNLTDAGAAGLQAAAPAAIAELITDPSGTIIGARINLAMTLPTTHTLVCGDARNLSWIRPGEIPLIVTSAPYFDLKQYTRVPGQLADLPTYNAFLDALDDVWRECLRVLIPGGRLIVNVGDVLRSRKQHGTHHILPLHAHTLTRATKLGFHALNGIHWNKIGNVSYEQNGSGVLGKPGQPNGIIAMQNEHLLIFRKPGPYRTPTAAQQERSQISKENYAKWFRQTWDDVPGARTTGAHPAPWPVEIPYRLINMFSFVGDTVLDVFGGSGSTAIAAAKANRDSVSVDISPDYLQHALSRVRNAAHDRQPRTDASRPAFASLFPDS